MLDGLPSKVHQIVAVPALEGSTRRGLARRVSTVRALWRSNQDRDHGTHSQAVFEVRRYASHLICSVLPQSPPPPPPLIFYVPVRDCFTCPRRLASPSRLAHAFVATAPPAGGGPPRHGLEAYPQSTGLTPGLRNETSSAVLEAQAFEPARAVKPSCPFVMPLHAACAQHHASAAARVANAALGAPGAIPHLGGVTHKVGPPVSAVGFCLTL